MTAKHLQAAGRPRDPARLGCLEPGELHHLRIPRIGVLGLAFGNASLRHRGLRGGVHQRMLKRTVHVVELSDHHAIKSALVRSAPGKGLLNSLGRILCSSHVASVPVKGELHPIVTAKAHEDRDEAPELARLNEESTRRQE